MSDPCTLSFANNKLPPYQVGFKKASPTVCGAQLLLSHRFLPLGHLPLQSVASQRDSCLEHLVCVPLAQPFLHWKRLSTVSEKGLSVVVSPIRTEHFSAGDLARGMVTQLPPLRKTPHFTPQQKAAGSTQPREQIEFHFLDEPCLALQKYFAWCDETSSRYGLVKNPSHKSETSPAHVIWRYHSVAVSNLLSDCLSQGCSS